MGVYTTRWKCVIMDQAETVNYVTVSVITLLENQKKLPV